MQRSEDIDGFSRDEASSQPALAPQMKLLRRLWAEALEVPLVGLDDDFFDLGGDSLAVARIVITAAAEGVTIDPDLFIQCRTIREMEREMKVGH